MKKIFGFVVLVAGFMMLFGTGVCAATTYKYEIANQDFTKAYTNRSYYYGNMSCEYKPGSGSLWWKEYARTRTGEFMLINGKGYVASTIIAVNGSTKHTYLGISAAAGGWTYCSWASVNDQDYAKGAVHYADVRNQDGSIAKIYTVDVN